MNLINNVLLKAGILKDIAKSPLPDTGIKWFEHVSRSEMILAGIIILIIIAIALILKSRYNRWREKSQINNSISSIDEQSTVGESESTIASIDRLISTGKGLEYINGLGEGSNGSDGPDRSDCEYGPERIDRINENNGFDPRLY